jgi:hypothetical protein
MAPAIMVALALGGCDSFLDVNENPNAPEFARVELRIAPLITGMGHSVLYQGPTLWGSEWMQQWSFNRLNRGWAEIHRYELHDISADGAWSFYHATMLNEARLIMAETDPQVDPAYHGLAKFIWAWTWLHVTDLWGPVPFTEAFNTRIPAPAYDDQRVVYEQALQWIDEAIGLMKTPTPRVPGANDLLFGGNMARWVKLARVVQARHHLRLSSAPWANRQERAQAALTALQEGFASNADDADFTYPGGADARNPHWQFQQNWRVMKTSETLLEGVLRPRNDPRIPVLVAPALADLDDGNIVYRGHKPGSGQSPDSTVSDVGHFFTNQNAPLNWVSFADAKFTEAEARLILTGAAAADAPYRAGIRANMEKLGVAEVEITAYLAARPNLATLDQPLKEIIREKNIANFLKIEPWHDFRRTGYPDDLELVDQALLDAIPIRIRTPGMELDRNGQNARATGVPVGMEGMLYKSDKVWWGGRP